MIRRLVMAALIPASSLFAHNYIAAQGPETAAPVDNAATEAAADTTPTNETTPQSGVKQINSWAEAKPNELEDKINDWMQNPSRQNEPSFATLFKTPPEVSVAVNADSFPRLDVTLTGNFDKSADTPENRAKLGDSIVGFLNQQNYFADAFQTQLTTDNMFEAGNAKMIEIQLRDNNQPPKLVSRGPLRVPVDEPVDLALEATDSNTSDTLTFSATGLPNGLTLDRETGMVSGTATTVGDYTVTLKVTDDRGSEDVVETQLSVVPGTPFTAPKGLSHNHRALLACLGFINGPCDQRAFPYTAESCLELATKAYAYGMYADAVVYAKHGQLWEETNPSLIYLRAASSLAQGKSDDAYAALKELKAVPADGYYTRLRERLSSPTTIALDMAMQQMND
ncbi:Ig domain-containing protein [Thalassoroseus pseudoceratinae]|uniref:Ig domain-containing protein n=1 Tax=Thalassoroseus pseudoceratinae TaxID=2713176 RepID=UPI0019823F9C|nr:Ig domain-containing protein [Thalassoroseus pseudoceratinae]